METVATGHVTPAKCKVAYLLWCPCCHHTPLLQSPGLSAKHHPSPSLTWPTWSSAPCRTPPPVSGTSSLVFKTSALVLQLCHLSMAALHPDSKHTSLVLSWLCSFIITASLVYYSPLNLPLPHQATLYTSWHPTGKRVRPTTLLSLLGWPLSQSQQGKADIKLYGYLHSIVMYNIPHTPPYGTHRFSTSLADSGISVTQLFTSLCYGPWLASLCFPWWYISSTYTNIAKHSVHLTPSDTKCGTRRVRLCLPRSRGTLVAWWVECWMADSVIRSGVGLNPSRGSHNRWCQKVPVLPANWLYHTIPA